MSDEINRRLGEVEKKLDKLCGVTTEILVVLEGLKVKSGAWGVIGVMVIIISGLSVWFIRSKALS